MAFTWRLYLRDSSLVRQGEIDDYASLEVIQRFNDAGTWTLEMDRRQRHAAALTTPGAGIVLYRDATVVMSGPAVSFEHDIGDRQRLTVHGADDNIWLPRRAVSPVPSASSPPYSAQEHDVRTGTTSTILRQYADVNAGPSAVTARRVPGLTIGTDPAAGSSVTGRGRWQDLLTLEKELATAGGIGFRLLQSGAALQFQTYAPTDRTGTVKFSLDLGNLSSYKYSLTAPEANYVYVLGGGEGTARTVRERADWTSIGTWGRVEKVIDRRDTTDTTELDQAGAEALIQYGQKTSLEITPIDTTQLVYGAHYDLGDRVTVALDDTQIQDIVRQVTISMTPAGQRVIPAVSTDRTDVLKIFAAFRRMAQRIADLERRR